MNKQDRPFRLKPSLSEAAIANACRLRREAAERAPLRALERRRKIERAIDIVRGGIAVRAACRSVGLRSRLNVAVVTEECDRRGIYRRRFSYRVFHTLVPVPAIVKR